MDEYLDLLTIAGAQLYEDVYPGEMFESDSEKHGKRRGYGKHDDDDYDDDDFDDDYDDDDYDDEDAITAVDATDYDEVMDAVRDRRFDHSDLEYLVEEAMAEGVHFDSDDVEEICARIHWENLKGRLWSQV